MAKEKYFDGTYEFQGVFPLSEGAIFPKGKNTEHVAITVHDHAEVVTCKPTEALKILGDIDNAPNGLRYLVENTDYYQNLQDNYTAEIGSSLWVALCRKNNGVSRELHKIPLVNPTQDEINDIADDGHVIGVSHIGTLKQTYMPHDDTWNLTFSPYTEVR